MSATDELQKLLDERMVEWTYKDGTVRYESDGHWHLAWAYNDDKMVVSMGYLTPEQSIAATLGAGTCHIKELDALTQTLSMAYDCAWGECSGCGYLTPDNSTYCINCGRKVAGE